MAKEWILNMATNRWGLNKKRAVGPVSEWIRECSPATLEEWESCYMEKLREFLRSRGIEMEPEEYLKSLGEKLYVKITEVIRAEIEEVTETDCTDYIRRLVIERTFDGYLREKDTIYKQLQEMLGVPIKPAPDEWDRRYNVDFYIEVNGRYIGIQIKPISYRHAPEIHRWEELMRKSHERFARRFGGRVFIVYSIKEGNRKRIYNPEVVDEIRREMERLRTS